MCMSHVKTENFPDSNIAWKVMTYDNDRWRTPYRCAKPIDNKLKAYEKPDISLWYGHAWRILHGGAIHCYRTKLEAEATITRSYHRVFEVKGTNPIGYTDSQIAFEEIEFVDDLSKQEI